MKKIYALTLAFCTTAFFVNAQPQLIRGPYLQKKTQHSMNIKWRTDVPANAKVYYGTDLNNLNQTNEEVDVVVDHEVMIDGLQAFTKYFYKIESDGKILAGGDSSFNFRTAPVPGTVQPVRVWATGDFGKGNNGQRLTRDAYLEYSKNKETDVWLWLGDNAYQDGTDQDYQDKVFEQYYAYGNIFKFMHFYPSPGNHDYNSVCPIPCPNTDPHDHTGPYYDIITAPTHGEAGGEPSSLENYYSYDYANVHFISLNSELGSTTAAYDYIGAYTNGYTNSPMLQWLRDDLEQNTQPWIIAYWHQPPYTKGSHNSDLFYEFYMKAMRQNIIPILEEYGIDLVVNGHSHAYERSYLLHGHYDVSSTLNAQDNILNATSGDETKGEAYIKYTDGAEPNKGTVYVVCGNSGNDVDASKALFYNGNPHPAMFYWDGGKEACGSFVIDIEDNKLVGKYLTSTGYIKDQFTILKQSITASAKEVNNRTEAVSKAVVYPNPFVKQTNLSFELIKPADLTITIVSTDGKVSRALGTNFYAEGSHEITLDSDKLHLAKGEYILRIEEGEKASFERIVKVD